MIKIIKDVYGDLRPPKPPDIGTGGKPLASPSISTQNHPITPSISVGINAQSSLPNNLKTAGIPTSDHTHGRGTLLASFPHSNVIIYGGNSSISTLKQAEFNSENCPVMMPAMPPGKNSISDDVRSTHGGAPLGIGLPSLGTPIPCMGQHQFYPQQDEFDPEKQAAMNSLQAGSKIEFSGSVTMTHGDGPPGLGAIHMAHVAQP